MGHGAGHHDIEVRDAGHVRVLIIPEEPGRAHEAHVDQVLELVLRAVATGEPTECVAARGVPPVALHVGVVRVVGGGVAPVAGDAIGRGQPEVGRAEPKADGALDVRDHSVLTLTNARDMARIEVRVDGRENVGVDGVLLGLRGRCHAGHRDDTDNQTEN